MWSSKNKHRSKEKPLSALDWSLYDNCQINNADIDFYVKLVHIDCYSSKQKPSNTFLVQEKEQQKQSQQQKVNQSTNGYLVPKYTIDNRFWKRRINREIVKTEISNSRNHTCFINQCDEERNPLLIKSYKLLSKHQSHKKRITQCISSLTKPSVNQNKTKYNYKQINQQQNVKRILRIKTEPSKNNIIDHHYNLTLKSNVKTQNQKFSQLCKNRTLKELTYYTSIKSEKKKIRTEKKLNETFSHLKFVNL